MSGISGINSSLNNTYSQLSSGRKLQSAKDGAAEMAIVQEENAQVKGLDQGARNMESGKEMLNVADSGLSSINDYLQRIKELAVSASNTATVSDAERSAMQEEVEQLKQGISDVAANTSYNTKNLLDGSNPSFAMATDANGNSRTIDMGTATLESLGIKDFDLTKDFNMEDIDKAIESVNEKRSAGGAQYNALDYGINYNSQASYNLTSAKSKLEDLDYPKAVSEKKKEETLQQYSLMMQRKKMEEEANRMKQLFT